MNLECSMSNIDFYPQKYRLIRNSDISGSGLHQSPHEFFTISAKPYQSIPLHTKPFLIKLSQHFEIQILDSGCFFHFQAIIL
ncbi:hypothetical protein SAMN04488028_101698 [Reichenbachiella agariperforans]|uniref:Uncharacterized protein n=1 Tax=Reichenbachiella agariperforans TaxID=156994 RepID=A0A1M6KT90_REIAG|nr:hypothetical protein SAMN04488028_101698 [Reichenbachiella agariperforans]